jgi:hypothetical protein
VEVTPGRSTDKRNDIDIIRLKYGMAFLQVKSAMTMKEKLQQVSSAICVNRKETAHTPLEQ